MNLFGSGPDVDTSLTDRSVASDPESGARREEVLCSGSSTKTAVRYPAARWPLIGREEELADLVATMVRPGPGSVVVAGRPGIGRTRLARDALHQAQSAGFVIEWFVATSAAASVPFGAFARLLEGIDLEASDRLTLFLTAVESLAERAGGRRLVLGVDDAHLLDQPAAALLHQVAATGTAFVMATVRTGEPAPEPILALGKDGLGRRLDLQPLAAAQLERLVATALDGPVDGATLRVLIDSTRGDVSFLRELIDAGLDSGALAEADGIWAWTGPLAAHPRLVAVVESRLGRLQPEERVVLELLSEGEPLELALLERLVPAGVLESVERKGLLEVERDDQRVSVRLVHPIHGDVLRATTPPVRARALRRRLAAVLHDTGRRRPRDVLRSSTWTLEAGEAVAPQELVAAAGRAESSGDHILAERLARAAVAAGAGFPAIRLLSRALVEQGRPAEADSLLTDPAAAVGADAEPGTVTVARAVNLYHALGIAADLEEVLRQAEEMLFGLNESRAPGGSETEAQVTVLQAMRALTAGRPDEALRAATAVLRESRTDEPTQLRALIVTSMALAMAGRTQQAHLAVARGMDLAPRCAEDVPQASLSLLAASTVAHRYAGDLVEAEALAASGYRRTLLEERRATRTLWTVLLGRTALDCGRVRTAAGWFREGVALSRAVSPLGQLPWCLVNLSIAAGQAGDLSAAAAALAEAEDLCRPTKELFDGDFLLAGAWTAAAGGEMSRAVKLALEAGDMALERGQLSFAASAVHDAVRLGEVDRAVGRLTGVVSAVDGRKACLLGAHAAALQAGDGAALDEVSVAFEGLGARLFAAEAAAEAAAVHRRDGRTGRSLASSDRARVLEHMCEGARTPALRQLQPDVLTRREREVAALAARGLSNRDIAELLVVSVRTVENQLHRVYAKLAVGGRDELASALAPRPEEAAPERRI
jgi:DNA-binding CsgD family transcriptional regulator